jgi:hypothetical protein
MDVSIVLLVVKDDVVIEHHWLSILSVPVTLLNEERHSLRRRVVRKFQLLALSVNG